MLINRRREADMKHAWDELVETLTSARGATMDQARGLFNDAQESFSDSGRETRRRLANAADALAGRPTSPRWGLIAAAGAIGAVAGASAIIAAQIARSRRTRTTTDQPMLGADETLSPAERERILNTATKR